MLAILWYRKITQPAARQAFAGVSAGWYYWFLSHRGAQSDILYSHLITSCRMKLLLFQKKLLWSLRTWQNGHSPISPNGSVVSGLSRSSPWMWGRMGRKRPWQDTDNPHWTVAWTSKIFWRKRLTLVSIPYFLLWEGACGSLLKTDEPDPAMPLQIPKVCLSLGQRCGDEIPVWDEWW